MRKEAAELVSILQNELISGVYTCLDNTEQIFLEEGLSQTKAIRAMNSLKDKVETSLKKSTEIFAKGAMSSIFSVVGDFELEEGADTALVQQASLLASRVADLKRQEAQLKSDIVNAQRLLQDLEALDTLYTEFQEVNELETELLACLNKR